MGDDVVKYITGKIKKSEKNSQIRKTCYVYIKEIKDRLDKIDQHI